MAAKIALAVCANALLIQGIFSQCIPGPAIIDDYALSRFGAYGSGIGYSNTPIVAPTSGGGFIVTSASPTVPTGVTVISENAIEGALSVIGELPFLGAVTLEGALPTAGVGGINYGCGDGNVAIVSEVLTPVGYPAGLAYPGLPGAAAYGPALPGYGYGLGYSGIY